MLSVVPQRGSSAPGVVARERRAFSRDLVVFSELGSLTKEGTTVSDAVAEAVVELGRRRMPLVLTTSRARAQVEPLHHLLRLSSPFIVENGAAILIPDGCFRHPPLEAQREGGLWVWVLGRRRAVLGRMLVHIAAEAGARVRRVGDPSGSGPDAVQPEYGEPFVLDGDGDGARALHRAAQARGLRVRAENGCHVLAGPTDKGRAVRALAALYGAEGRLFTSIALSDSVDDLDVLRAVDRPVVVPRPEGGFDPCLTRDLRGVECAPCPGPAGWSYAVLAILRGERLRRLV